MKVDITELLITFDELTKPPTDEELGVYWFDKIRPDGSIITLSFSLYEHYVSVLVHNNDNIAFAHIRMKNCSEIRILDEEKKCLEIIHDDNKGRCFLHLTGENIVTYEE